MADWVDSVDDVDGMDGVDGMGRLLRIFRLLRAVYVSVSSPPPSAILRRMSDMSSTSSQTSRLT